MICQRRSNKKTKQVKDSIKFMHTCKDIDILFHIITQGFVRKEKLQQLYGLPSVGNTKQAQGMAEISNISVNDHDRFETLSFKFQLTI